MILTPCTTSIILTSPSSSPPPSSSRSLSSSLLVLQSCCQCHEHSASECHFQFVGFCVQWIHSKVSVERQSEKVGWHPGASRVPTTSRAAETDPTAVGTRRRPNRRAERIADRRLGGVRVSRCVGGDLYAALRAESDYRSTTWRCLDSAQRACMRACVRACVCACVRACVRVCAHTNVHKHCVRVSLKLQVFDIQLGVWKITGGCWKPDGVVL